MSKIIVTGGSGFIGSHLLNKIINSKKNVKILVLDIKPPRVTHRNIEYIYCDIREPIDLSLNDNYDTCYHLAALCKEPGFDWDEYFLTNQIGTVNVCDWLARNNINNLIFTSTMMTFRAGEKCDSESSLASPNTAYGISKLLAEHSIQEWQATNTQRRIRMVRLGVVFGKWEEGNYTRLYYSLKKKRFAYIGKKSTIKGSIYVKDAVDFLIILTTDTYQHQLYNLAYKESTSIEYICTSIQEAFDFKKHYIPTVPYALALSLAYGFEFLSLLGLKTSIHHRRIQKLYQSTNIAVDRAYSIGFAPKFTLKEAFQDWHNDCEHKDLY